VGVYIVLLKLLGFTKYIMFFPTLKLSAIKE